MEKLPCWEVDRGMGQLMDRPEIAYVLAPGFRFPPSIDCWGHKSWPTSHFLHLYSQSSEYVKTSVLSSGLQICLITLISFSIHRLKLIVEAFPHEFAKIIFITYNVWVHEINSRNMWLSNSATSWKRVTSSRNCQSLCLPLNPKVNNQNYGSVESYNLHHPVSLTFDYFLPTDLYLQSDLYSHVSAIHERPWFPPLHQSRSASF